MSAGAEGRAITHRTLDISNFSIAKVGAVERMVERSRERPLGLAAERGFAAVPPDLRGAVSPHADPLHAAMADHVSIDTQVQHYTKRRSCWSKEEISDVPVPVQEHVARIKRRLELLVAGRGAECLYTAVASAGAAGHRRVGPRPRRTDAGGVPRLRRTGRGRLPQPWRPRPPSTFGRLVAAPLCRPVGGAGKLRAPGLMPARSYPFPIHSMGS